MKPIYLLLILLVVGAQTLQAKTQYFYDCTNEKKGLRECTTNYGFDVDGNPLPLKQVMETVYTSYGVEVGYIYHMNDGKNGTATCLLDNDVEKKLVRK